MSEKPQVGEPRPTYRVSSGGPEESVLERVQIQFPPYFERFLDERDQRIAAEIRRLEAAVERNGQDIARVLRDMDFRFGQVEHRFGEVDRRLDEMRAEMDRRFTEVRAEMDRRFTEVRAEMDRRFAEVDHRLTELTEGQKSLRAEVRTHFYWTIGLLFPVIASVVAMVIRIFFYSAP